LNLGAFLFRPLQSNNLKWPSSLYFGEKEDATFAGKISIRFSQGVLPAVTVIIAKTPK